MLKSLKKHVLIKELAAQEIKFKKIETVNLILRCQGTDVDVLLSAVSLIPFKVKSLLSRNQFLSFILLSRIFNTETSL